jgi:hypothetical protein
MKQRFAQMPPMDPSMMGMPPGGAPPMDPSMMGGAPPMGAAPMGGAPPGPPPPPPGKEPLLGPLKGVGDVLKDAGIEELVASNPDADDERLAIKVWTQYGGKPDGKVDPRKVGQRKTGQPPEMADVELQETEDKRWERLPKGRTIGDITSLGEMAEMMRSIIFGAVKKLKTPPAPPGGAPGMPPPMAATNVDMMRLAVRMLPVASDLADRLRTAADAREMRWRS